MSLQNRCPFKTVPSVNFSFAAFIPISVSAYFLSSNMRHVVKAVFFNFLVEEQKTDVAPTANARGRTSFTHFPCSRHPSLKWAQRSDKIYLTVELPDAKDVKLQLEPEGKFKFSATKDGVPYEVDIELFDKVDTEESKVNIGVRHIVYVIKKAEKRWWSRLLKQEGKPPVFLKVDWDKWVDEDEEEEKSGMDFDDMDFSKLDMGGDDYDMDDDLNEEEERKKGMLEEVQAKEEDKIKEEEELGATTTEEAKA